MTTHLIKNSDLYHARRVTLALPAIIVPVLSIMVDL